MTDARALLDRLVSEADFQRAVVELAELLGWMVWHDHDSRRNAAGWPDLVLAKPGRPLLLWECKSARGRVRPEQRAWLDVLAQATGVDARVVRPGDWAEIERMLKE